LAEHTSCAERAVVCEKAQNIAAMDTLAADVTTADVDRL
jgi:hypothetical protein